MRGFISDLTIALRRPAERPGALARIVDAYRAAGSHPGAARVLGVSVRRLFRLLETDAEVRALVAPVLAERGRPMRAAR